MQRHSDSPVPTYDTALIFRRPRKPKRWRGPVRSADRPDGADPAFGGRGGRFTHAHHLTDASISLVISDQFGMVKEALSYELPSVIEYEHESKHLKPGN